MNLLRTGVRILAGGTRRGSAALSGLGTALLALGWLRRRAGPKKRLLYGRTLRRGEAVRIRLLGAEPGGEVEIEG